MTSFRYDNRVVLLLLLQSVVLSKCLLIELLLHRVCKRNCVWYDVISNQSQYFVGTSGVMQEAELRCQTEQI